MHLSAIWDLHYRNCRTPICGGARVQQDDRQSWFSNKFFPKKTGNIYRIGPPQKTKALFRGVWDLVLVPSKGKPALGEAPGYLGGRLRTHTGHGTSQFVAVNMMGPGKTQKTARILPHSMIVLMSSVRLMANLVVHSDSF